MGSGHDADNPILGYQLIYIFRFLLASLNIQAILQEPTLHRRQERLSNMTDGLGLEDVYGATIERIKEQGGYKCRLGMGALIWISYAERPLEVDELCHALAIDIGSANFNPANIPSISTLVSCCQGLLTVDKEASNVRLIHFTLKEYFSAHPDIFSRPHSTIAEICLTYLNSQKVKALSIDPSTNPKPNSTTLLRNKPFLKYCSLYWGVHAKRELSDRARSLALELFKEYKGHISAVILLGWELLGFFNMGPPFNGLHCASLLGISELVAALIATEKYDPNEKGVLGYAPLSWAAMKGHEEVVKVLLTLEEVDPNQLDVFGESPLSLAASRGHKGVVKILVEREGVNLDEPNADGRTPLSVAAERGHEEVAKILLGRDEVYPTGQIIPAEHLCRMPLRMERRNW